MEVVNSWNDRKEVQKGNYGEKIVREYLEGSGWVVYEPKTEGPHAFDKLCVKDKQSIVIAEVKTKARMNKWNATGFNKKSFNEYKYIVDKYGIDIFIFFVDEMLRKIYGNKLTTLERPYIANDGTYPMELKNIILFSLETMKVIKDIEEDDVKYLIEHSNRNYDYGE